MELTVIDYKILEFVNKFSEPIHVDEILSKFPDNEFATNYRLELLREMERHSSGHFCLENTSYIELNYSPNEYVDGDVYKECLNTYNITEKGKKELYDYKIRIKEKRIETFWKIFPIIVSTIALLKSFDKQIISVWLWLTQSLK